MNIEEKYRPYNFSSTKCHVVRKDFSIVGSGAAYFGIEEKLPEYIGRLKGIYVTCNGTTRLKGLFGALFLSFNEGVLKSVQLPLWPTAQLKDTAHPIPLDEEILSHSLMQGYVAVLGRRSSFSGNISIYLHYEERKCKGR